MVLIKSLDFLNYLSYLDVLVRTTINQNRAMDEQYLRLKRRTMKAVRCAGLGIQCCLIQYLNIRLCETWLHAALGSYGAIVQDSEHFPSAQKGRRTSLSDNTEPLF